MSFRTLGFIAAHPDSDGPALDAAIDLARRTGAHLDVTGIGVDVTLSDPVIAGGMPLVLAAGQDDARARAEAAATWAESRMPRDFTAWTVEPIVAPQAGIEGVISGRGRYADLFVAARPYGPDADPIHATILESALFHAGAPILMVPKTGLPPAFYDGPVLVAWDESDASLAAIRAALPLLIGASTAHVVMVDPPSHSSERSDPGGPLCLMLSRHGVRAEVSLVARTLPTIAEVLMRFARDHECGALVIGGYGHSRLRERMFGGVTRHLLERSELPLVLAR